jgi:hypothetical protein
MMFTYYRIEKKINVADLLCSLAKERITEKLREDGTLICSRSNLSSRRLRAGRKARAAWKFSDPSLRF